MECKEAQIGTIESTYLVLIETLWNVKRTIGTKAEDAISFNRNIVECKVFYNDSKSIFGRGFNRNIVECKVEIYFRYSPSIYVLIETLWNVKCWIT